MWVLEIPHLIPITQVQSNWSIKTILQRKKEKRSQVKNGLDKNALKEKGMDIRHYTDAWNFTTELFIRWLKNFWYFYWILTGLSQTWSFQYFQSIISFFKKSNIMYNANNYFQGYLISIIIHWWSFLYAMDHSFLLS